MYKNKNLQIYNVDKNVLFLKNCHQLLDESLRVFFEFKKDISNPCGVTLVVNCLLCCTIFFLGYFYLYFSISHYLFLLIEESTFRIISLLFLDII